LIFSDPKRVLLSVIVFFEDETKRSTIVFDAGIANIRLAIDGSPGKTYYFFRQNDKTSKSSSSSLHRFRGVEAIDTFESKHYTKRFFLTVDVRNIVTSDESLVIEFDSFLSDEISLINDVRLILAKHFSSDVLQFNRLN